MHSKKFSFGKKITTCIIYYIQVKLDEFFNDEEYEEFL